jgi:hypothetical protein
LNEVPPFRVFVSSPGDVADAREMVAQTIERLALEYRRFFAIEPYLWENEAMLASGHFQDSIDPPSKFDVVLLILGGRLGTPLPARTAVREYKGIDGRVPVTGTEWEFEEALASARTHGAPDLLVYRSQRDLKISVDVALQQQQLRQLEALNAFWSRHFADRGAFIGAYSVFESLGDLATAVERDLSSLIRRRLERGGASALAEAPAPIWLRDPFRGLASYDFEHAPIYFGRSASIGKAMLQLLQRAEGGEAFLLIQGASGAGKSSLMKAGLAPRLFEPRRVPAAAFLRRVVFEPGVAGKDEDLFAAFAKALTTGAGDVGIPELLGPSMTSAHLAEHLRDPQADLSFAVARCLDELAASARRRGRMLDYQQPKLLLLVDQLEELFTDPGIESEARRRFIAMLAALARSGWVWVVATMRSDLWRLAAEAPELVRLGEGAGRLDLMPPSAAEVGQMIRMPARAAGLTFEVDPESGVPLDEAISEEAVGEAGALPLLSSLMETLCRGEGGLRLTYAEFERLGRLKGAIAARADETLAAQPPEVRAALPRLLFALVRRRTEDEQGAAPLTRRAPLAALPPDGPERRLAEALADARLIVLDEDAAGLPQARLAHEALITHWSAAREAVASLTRALAIRAMTEERLRRWRTLSERDQNAALLAGADLADAQRLVADFGGLAGREVADFVAKSGDAAKQRRRVRVRWVAGLSAGGLALAAGTVAAVVAEQMAELSARAQSADRVLLARAAAARLAYDQADYASAASDYVQSEQLADQLIGLEGDNLQWRYNLAASQAFAAYSYSRAGDGAPARREYLAAAASAADLAGRDGADATIRGYRVRLQQTLQRWPIPPA